MDFNPNIKTINRKEYIFCQWRAKFVRLTPEEWVRQYFLTRLETLYDYPHLYIGVEIPLKNRRADAIVYTKNMKPHVIIECKAETVPLDQHVLDQLAIYNQQLHAPFLFLTNGEDTLVAKIENNRHLFYDHIPAWKQLFN